MKDKKFIIVTGASMFLLLMMILFNFGGPKSTYSSIVGCASEANGSCLQCAPGYECQGTADALNFGTRYSCAVKAGSPGDSCPAYNPPSSAPASSSSSAPASSSSSAPASSSSSAPASSSSSAPASSSSSAPASSSSSGTTSVRPSLSVNVDSSNKVHVSLTTLWGCGGTLKVTGSGVSIGGTTSKSVDNTTAVTSLVTGAYTKSSGATKGTITATYTITSTAAGYSCPASVTKTITVFDDTPPADNSVTETICTSGGGTWSNDECTCPTGKVWSTVYKECRCPIGQKDFNGVCKYGTGISIVANKDVIMGTSHPLNVNTGNGSVCGGKVTLTSSAGNSISGFNVDSDSVRITYTPTKSSNGTGDGTDTITAKLEGIDTSKCYMIDSTTSFTLNLTNDKEKMCKKYNGTWNEATKKCNCNNGFYWSDEINKCLAYSAADDPTRIAPYIQLSWNDIKIKKGSSEKLTICAKASNNEGAAGVGGRYYISGYNHSNGSLQQEAVPAGGCSNVTVHGITVGTDTLKIEFSPDDDNHYKPVYANATVCVYDDDQSICGSGGDGGSDGGTDGTNPGGDGGSDGTNPGGGPGGNTSTNPQTGNIMLFVVWIIGFGCIGYSFWYFKNVNKNGA